MIIYFKIQNVTEKLVHGNFDMPDCIGVILVGTNTPTDLPLSVNIYHSHSDYVSSEKPALIKGQIFNYRYPLFDQQGNQNPTERIDLYNYVLPLIKDQTGWSDAQIAITQV